MLENKLEMELEGLLTNLASRSNQCVSEHQLLEATSHKSSPRAGVDQAHPWQGKWEEGLGDLPRRGSSLPCVVLHPEPPGARFRR
jgi:hypothetical protein